MGTPFVCAPFVYLNMRVSRNVTPVRINIVNSFH